MYSLLKHSENNFDVVSDKQIDVGNEFKYSSTNYIIVSINEARLEKTKHGFKGVKRNWANVDCKQI